MLHRLSRPFAVRTSLGLALIGGIGVATLSALHPAVAASIIAQVNTLASCATTTACVTGANTSNGPGVTGTSKTGTGVVATSSSGNALVAASTSVSGIYASSTNGSGIFAYSAKSSGVNGSSAKTFGVFGTSAGTGSNSAGVYGSGATVGVLGDSSNTDGWGVIGNTSNGTGVQGNATGNGGIGTYGGSENGTGVWASSATGAGLNAESSAGIAVRAHVYGSNFSVVGTSDNLQGNGADFEGGRFGIIGRALPSGYPLVLTDNAYNNVFYVSGTGDVFIHGNLQSFARTAGGAAVSSYTAKSSEPTVEDTGTAQLTAGSATVMLDPTFAATVDKSTTYRVFLTPDGDTRGLFVALKTARGFIVRETQGGRSTLAFDYRIVATSQGQAGKRMMVQSAAATPNAPIPPAGTQQRPNVRIVPGVAAAALIIHPNGTP